MVLYFCARSMLEFLLEIFSGERRHNYEAAKSEGSVWVVAGDWSASDYWSVFGGYRITWTIYFLVFNACSLFRQAIKWDGVMKKKKKCVDFWWRSGAYITGYVPARSWSSLLFFGSVLFYLLILSVVRRGLLLFVIKNCYRRYCFLGARRCRCPVILRSYHCFPPRKSFLADVRVFHLQC